MQAKIKWCLLGLLLIPCWVMGIKYEIDLVVLHATAKFLITDFTRVYAQNGVLGRYFYGPFSLILIKPLGYLNFTIVKYFWLCLQTFCYFWFWRFLSSLYPVLNDKKWFWGWFLVWIISINPIHNNFQSNNIQLMLATTLLLAETLCRNPSSKKQVLGGMLVAFTAGVKVFPGFLLVYYFLAKSTATRKGILAGSAVVLLSPFLFLGIEKSLFLYRGFFLNLTTYSAENSLTRINDILCIPSLLARLSVPSPLINGCVLLLSALFFGWVWVSKNKASFTREEPYFLGLSWALSVLLNPSTRPHYFIFYVPAFCSLVEYLSIKPKARGVMIATLIATLLIAFTAEGVTGKALNDWLEAASVPTIGMTLLCLTLCFVIRDLLQSEQPDLSS